jgi:hypothetical protein
LRGFGRWFGRPQQRTSEGAAADLAGVRASVLRLGTHESKGGSGVLTLLRSRGGQRGWRRGGVEGDRGGGSGIPAEEGGAVRSDGEEEAPGCRVLVLAARVAMGGAMSLKRWSPTTRSAGWPAMARRPVFTVAAPVGRCGACTGAGKGRSRGSATA